MRRLKTIALIAVACCAGVMMPLAAQAKAIKFTSGLVGADGSLIAGGDFLVLHNGTGDYTLVFGKGAFKNVPVVTCTAASINSLLAICNIASDLYSGDGSATVEIKLYSRSEGKLEDNAFAFTEVTTH
jgi:hypothetical protein